MTRERFPGVSVEGGVLSPRVERLMVGSRDCTKLVEGVTKQVEFVRVALDSGGLAHVPVAGMLCFVEADWPIFGGDFSISGVRVLWPRKAADRIGSAGSIDAPTAAQTLRTLASAFPEYV